MDGPVLVTGATGFIGRRLVARLLRAGTSVRALVLPREDTSRCWPRGAVEEVAGDVTDRASVDRAARGAATVYHLAAIVGDWGDEAVYRQVTVDGTASVLGAAAREGARAVLASSVVVYGDEVRRAECGEDHPWGRPLGAYSRSKQAQELLGWRIARSAGLRLTALRFVNVYGPGSRPWVDEVVTQLKSGLPSLIAGGNGVAGLCHVENAALALALAGSRDAAVGRSYNVCDGSSVTWRRYFEDLAGLVGAPPPRSLPWRVAQLGAHACEAAWSRLRLEGRPPLTHEALNLVGSDHRVPIERARRELGFEPAVGYDEGLASVAAYLGTR